jgi:hypothetical protein
MNINELFNEFQNEFEENELRGEFILQGNVIIWSFNLSDDEDILDCVEEEDDEYVFNYDSKCDEELLIEAYHQDLDKIQLFLDELNEMENTSFSDYEIVDDVILFKIF